MYLKKNNGIVLRIVIFLLFLTAGAVCMRHISTVKTYSPDMIACNRIKAEVSAHITEEKQGEYEDYQYPFVVLNQEENLLFTYGADAVCSLADAVKNQDVVLPIEVDGRIKAIVIITVHKEREEKSREENMRFGLEMLSVLILDLILLILYDWYLHKNIVKPFSQVYTFSERLARGDLDASLNIHGNRVFTPFLQSMDVMREEIKTAKEREYQANQSKKELVASLSHDIKTPITAIKLAVEVLQVKETDEEKKGRLDAILKKTEQIDHLVTDLFHTTLEDLEELSVTPAETYSTELQTLILDADINHCVRKLTLPDCMIMIDPVRMGQIFTNIIYNSYKYAGTDIDITAVTAENMLIVTIQDYGNGVAPLELPCIFNRFYRGTNAENQTGSGLGLYICKRLMDKMNGMIYCENNEKGFAVLLKIPLV